VSQNHYLLGCVEMAGSRMDAGRRIRSRNMLSEKVRKEGVNKGNHQTNVQERRWRKAKDDGDDADTVN
jgi:hypothetical protein